MTLYQGCKILLIKKTFGVGVAPWNLGGNLVDFLDPKLCFGKKHKKTPLQGLPGVVIGNECVELTFLENIGKYHYFRQLLLLVLGASS